MNVIEGLRRIQKFFPGASFRMAGNDRLEAIHRGLHQVAQGPEPGDLRELIRRMDDAGLGIQEGGKVVVSQ